MHINLLKVIKAAAAAAVTDAAASAKGQLISKGLFGVLRFFQKMNETI